MSILISSSEAVVCGGFVAFHTDISNGTIAVRGDRPLTADVIAFWKIEIVQPLFGTSIMFGVGSSRAKRSLRYCFANLLGFDDQSYGLSYNGQIFHNGIGVQFCKPFHNPCSLSILFHGPSASIGFFRNEVFLGWAFKQVDLTEPLYPMISSTAQRSFFNVRSQWFRSVLPESLSEKCLEKISSLISEVTDVQRLPIPEFLKRSLRERIVRPRLNLQVSVK
uniref:SPRY domain-containing protein n=1 Tax=Syphacia muris TaxID=451379 RepID=A0A0N5AUS4_9BILA